MHIFYSLYRVYPLKICIYYSGVTGEYKYDAYRTEREFTKDDMPMEHVGNSVDGCSFMLYPNYK